MAKFYSAVPPRIKDVKKSLRRTLTALPDDFHVCFEFQVGNDYDVLIVHRKGIYVVEVKNDGRQIEGGSTMPEWHIRDDRGAVIARHNFFNQAKTAASNLREYLSRRSRDILLSTCSSPPCSRDLCTNHKTFWWDILVFPYVCIPDWNPKSTISSERLEYCHLVQGNIGRTYPPFIVTEIPRRTWDDKETTSYLILSEAEISRLIKALGCVPISQSQALGEEPVWFPKIDPQVVRASRGSELDDLNCRLQKEKVVAVVGEPKIGKSTLCQMLAADLNQSGIPVWDYDFRLADNSGIFATTQLLHDFLSKVELPEHQTLQDDIAALLGVLITQPGLVIIDNFETALDKDQIIADPAMSQFIEQLLNIREKLKSLVIITSITPFRTKTRLRPLQYSIPGISRDFAIEYLTTESRGWSATEAERIYNIRLGNPHAMRLASSEIRDILGHGLSFDEAYTQLAPEIVKLTYGISYDKFTPPERLALGMRSALSTE